MDSTVLEEDMEISYEPHHHVDLDDEFIDFATDSRIANQKHEIQEDLDMGEEYGGHIGHHSSAVISTTDTHNQTSSLDGPTNYDDIMLDDHDEGLTSFGNDKYDGDINVRDEELLDFDAQGDRDVDAEITDAPQHPTVEDDKIDQDVALLDDANFDSRAGKENIDVATETKDNAQESHENDTIASNTVVSVEEHKSSSASNVKTNEAEQAQRVHDNDSFTSPKAQSPSQASPAGRVDSVEARNFAPSNSNTVPSAPPQQSASVQAAPFLGNAPESEMQKPSKKRSLSRTSNDQGIQKKMRRNATDESRERAPADSLRYEQVLEDDQTFAVEPFQVDKAQLLTQDISTQPDPSNIGTEQGKAVEESALTAEPTVDEKPDRSASQLNSQAAQHHSDPSSGIYVNLFSKSKDEFGDVWKHPVTVLYEGEEYLLFADDHSRVEDHNFLEDRSLVYEPLQNLLYACREVLMGSIHEDDELELEVTDLGLVVSEHATISTVVKFIHILDLHVKICENDGSKDPKPLIVELRTKTNFVSRFQRLHIAAAQGYGLSQLSEVIGQGQAHLGGDEEGEAEEGDYSAEAGLAAEGEVQGEDTGHSEFVAGSLEEQDHGKENEDDVHLNQEDGYQLVNEDQYDEGQDYGQTGEGEEAEETYEGIHLQKEAADDFDEQADADETNEAYQLGEDYGDDTYDDVDNPNAEPTAGQAPSLDQSYVAHDDEEAVDPTAQTVPPADVYPHPDPDAPTTNKDEAELRNEDAANPEDIIDLAEDNDNQEQPAGEGHVYPDEGDNGDNKDEYGNPHFEIDYIGDEDDAAEDPNSSAAAAQDKQHDDDIDDDLIDYEEDERQHAAAEADGTHPNSPSRKREGAFNFFYDGANDEEDGGEGGESAGGVEGVVEVEVERREARSEGRSKE